jgi:hypothetical protein
MTDYALTPSVRRLRSALVIVSVDPDLRTPTRNLYAGHQEADAVWVSGVLEQELHHRDQVPDLRTVVERGVDRDDRVVGRGARKIDRHLHVRRLPRIERRDLVEELLGRDAGQLSGRRV